MKNIITICLVLLLAGSMTSFAQTSDPFAATLYEPDLVVKYTDDIGLTDAQARDMKVTYEKNISQFNKKKSDWSLAMVEFQEIISQPSVNYETLDKKFNEVLALESEIKKIKLKSLVEIKNLLTVDQQSKLDNIKKQNPEYNKAFELTLGFEEDSKIVIKKHESLSPDTKKEPLFILYGGDEKPTIDKKISSIDDVKPEDIQALSVYKGTAATDRFGEDGKNGVIEIKIKGPALKKYRKN
ncbi:hypothetical protein RT717_09625 [Imperialibacter roseus]|uniref:TonB-dependent receptor plug domain-containing protein n=1 Tax=Imperialibacter roseus TaxID=1324217 RepID=A0ABZ0IXN4_9BACT|nr:hypothetical protein [Imperialibacter roseus]WOK08894.1 hypothetical protein RT717_09625 [Imperialibacter roseus]